MPLPVGGLATALVLSLAAALLRVGGGPRVPLLDLSTTHGSAAYKVCRNAARLGALRLRGHSIDVDAALDASRRFFELPLSVKLEINASDKRPGFVRGYIPLGGEAGVADVLELKEGFSYGYDWPNETPPTNGLTGPNRWPSHAVLGGSDWRETMLAVHTNCSEIAKVVLHHISEALGGAPLPDTAGGESLSFIRLFHYLHADHSPETAPHAPRIGSSPHTDWHVLTIILQDTTGGLQILSRDGKWLNIPAHRGEIVALFGDYLAIGSEGRIHSAIHRVLLPKRKFKHRDSFTFFAYPPFNATLPLPTTNKTSQRSASELSAVGRFNTLVGDDPRERELLSRIPFGELLLRKWTDVVGNRVDEMVKANSTSFMVMEDLEGDRETRHGWQVENDLASGDLAQMTWAGPEKEMAGAVEAEGITRSDQENKMKTLGHRVPAVDQQPAEGVVAGLMQREARVDVESSELESTLVTIGEMAPMTRPEKEAHSNRKSPIVGEGPSTGVTNMVSDKGIKPIGSEHQVHDAMEAFIEEQVALDLSNVQGGGDARLPPASEGAAVDEKIDAKSLETMRKPSGDEALANVLDLSIDMEDEGIPVEIRTRSKELPSIQKEIRSTESMPKSSEEAVASRVDEVSVSNADQGEEGEMKTRMADRISATNHALIQSRGGSGNADVQGGSRSSYSGGTGSRKFHEREDRADVKDSMPTNVQMSPILCSMPVLSWLGTLSPVRLIPATTAKGCSYP